MTTTRDSETGPAPDRRAMFWRRRAVAIGVAVGVVAMVRPAAGAMGHAPPATARRPPSITYVVRSGDSLWAVARIVAPGKDPRAVVEALTEARHGRMLTPGEVIVWQE